MLRRTTLGLFLGLFWSGGALSAQEVDTLVVSLGDAERRALERSPLLAEARADLGIAEAQETQARHARYFPEATLRNVWGPIPRQRADYNEYGVLNSPDTALGIRDLRWFTQLDIELAQPIYGFGKISSRIKAAEHRTEASQAGLAGTETEVLFRVRELYWGVVLATELQRVVDGVLGQVAEAEEKLQEQYDEGNATQNDMFKFRLFEYEIHRRVREVETGLDEARAGLQAIMGVDDGVTVRVETEVLEPVALTLDSLDAYLAMARENRADLRELRRGIAARRSLVEAAESDRWPNLFVGGGFSMNRAPSRFDPENPFWRNPTNFTRGALLVGLDWDVNFLHHRDEARVQRFETAKLEALVDPLLAQVDREIRAAYNVARRARADLEEGEEALQASENWLRATLQTYDIGIGEINDVIDAFQANVQMETEQLRNVAEFNTAVAELSARVGRDLMETGNGGGP
jgi:cobalt-zinc-cadmium efflux system outer membrane protein